MHLSFDTTTSLPGIYPENTHPSIQKSIFIVMALFVVANYWKQLKRPFIEDWLNELNYTDTMEYYAAIKRAKNIYMN